MSSPDLAGILNVNKAKGWTSHDVVAKVRRLAGQRRVGHAGTLDPMAEGVLPVLLGRATRLTDFVQAGTKTYRATIHLGLATETDDAEGAVTTRARVPQLSDDLLEETLGRFRGAILQTPPRYSAVKVAGQRAYVVARAGAVVDLAPRKVTIHDLCLLSYGSCDLTLEVTCSKGTYVRALARDLAVALGTVGHLAWLLRTRVGRFSLEDALRLEEIAARGVATALLSPRSALPEAPTLHADAQQTARISNGQPVPISTGLRADAVWVYDPGGRLLCLASADGELLRPRISL